MAVVSNQKEFIVGDVVDFKEVDYITGYWTCFRSFLRKSINWTNSR